MRDVDAKIAGINYKIREKEKEIEKLKGQRQELGYNYPLCPYCGKRYKRKQWEVEKGMDDRVNVMCPNEHFIRLKTYATENEQVDINKYLEEIDEGYME